LFGNSTVETPTGEGKFDTAIEAEADVVPQSHVSQNQRELRYGCRDLEIFEIGIHDQDGHKTTLLDYGKEYVFYFKVKYVINLVEPSSFGFTISNVRGIEIYGTKGGLYDCFLPPGNKGMVIEARMRAVMRQVPGVYFLTVAVAPLSAPAATQFFDMRFDALQFLVIGNPKCFTTSIVDLEADLSFQIC
jgi:hypothetical protein